MKSCYLHDYDKKVLKKKKNVDEYVSQNFVNEQDRIQDA